MATSSKDLSPVSSKKERKILASYDIPLRYPYSFPKVLEEINNAIRQKIPCSLSYDTIEHWIRIRVYIPVSPETTIHSAIAFGWEVACLPPVDVFSTKLKEIIDVYHFCVANEALPSFKLSSERNILHIIIRAPRSSGKMRILEDYLSNQDL